MLSTARKVKDLMIPIDACATLKSSDPVKEATLKLRSIYCEVEEGKCTEAGHRTALVINESGQLEGILDFKSILAILIPELAGGFSAKFASLSTSVAFAEENASALDETQDKFRARVLKNASVRVSEVMLKIRGVIDPDADLKDALKAIYRNKIVVLPVVENGRVIGLVRDSDLFLAMADILIE